MLSTYFTPAFAVKGNAIVIDACVNIANVLHNEVEPNTGSLRCKFKDGNNRTELWIQPGLLHVEQHQPQEINDAMDRALAWFREHKQDVIQHVLLDDQGRLFKREQTLDCATAQDFGLGDPVTPLAKRMLASRERLDGPPAPPDNGEAGNQPHELDSPRAMPQAPDVKAQPAPQDKYAGSNVRTCLEASKYRSYL